MTSLRFIGLHCTLAALQFYFLPTFAMADSAAKASCLSDSIQRLSTASPTPVNWQNVETVFSPALPQSYRELILRNKIAIELRHQHGLGERLEFAIQHYDPKMESAARIARNGSELQAVYLKRLLNQIFPQANIRPFEANGPVNKNPSRTRVVMKIGDSAVTGSSVESSSSIRSIDPQQIEMGLLKSANPGPEVATKAQIRTAFNIREDAKVISVYGSARTEPDEVSSFVLQLLRAKSADTIIVSSNHYEAIRHLISQRMRNVLVMDSDKILPSKPGVQTVIMNETRGMLPVVHAAADRAVVLGSPNIIEPINVGVPTIAFREAEENFNQAVWTQQTDLISATAGGHVVNTLSEVLDLLEKPSLAKPVRKTYEVIDSNGTTAIDRLLTSLAKVTGDTSTPGALDAPGGGK